MTRYPRTSRRNGFYWRYHRLCNGILQHRRLRPFASDFVSERRWRQYQREYPGLVHLTADQAVGLWQWNLEAQARLN